jgi:hypothetical protein
MIWPGIRSAGIRAAALSLFRSQDQEHLPRVLTRNTVAKK